MTVKFTMDREQFEHLLRLAYLGDWMINGIRNEDEQIAPYNQLLQFLFSRAYEAGMDDIVEYSEDYNRWLPTEKFSEDSEIVEFIEDYNDDNFWEELVYRLAERDFEKQYGEDNTESMNVEDYLEKRHPFLEKYDEEVARNGIANLYVISPDIAAHTEH